MKLPVIHKDKNTNTTIYVVIAIVIIFAIYKAYQKVQENRQLNQAFDPGITTNPTTTTPKAPVYTNDSVFSTKNAATKIDRVQWIQNAYNQYAENRKLFGKTPDWAIIDDDGRYGNKTSDAMNRLMGKRSVSWNEVKTRTDYLQSQLNGNPFNFNWE